MPGISTFRILLIYTLVEISRESQKNRDENLDFEFRGHVRPVGGEQSGHMILSDYATTGDGLLAALQVLAVLIEDGRPASDVCRVFTPYPQHLKNVRYSGDSPLDKPSVQAAIADAEALLETSGRLLIRKSGTEPLIRVMAEGQDEAQVLAIVDALVAEIAAVAV